MAPMLFSLLDILAFVQEHFKPLFFNFFVEFPSLFHVVEIRLSLNSLGLGHPLPLHELEIVRHLLLSDVDCPLLCRLNLLPRLLHFVLQHPDSIFQKLAVFLNLNFDCSRLLECQLIRLQVNFARSL